MLFIIMSHTIRNESQRPIEKLCFPYNETIYNPLFLEYLSYKWNTSLPFISMIANMSLMW
jgi:hypothetical protein